MSDTTTTTTSPPRLCTIELSLIEIAHVLLMANSIRNLARELDSDHTGRATLLRADADTLEDLAHRLGAAHANGVRA